jgi:hypothetical protein
MQRAIDAVNSGEMGGLRASKQFGAPQGIVRKREEKCCWYQQGIGLFSCNIRCCARNIAGAAFETLNVGCLETHAPKHRSWVITYREKWISSQIESGQ